MIPRLSHHFMQKNLLEVITASERRMRDRGLYWRGDLLLIELFQLLDPAKGNPVNDRVIHAHHECWRNDKLTVFIMNQSQKSALSYGPDAGVSFK